MLEQPGSANLLATAREVLLKELLPHGFRERLRFRSQVVDIDFSDVIYKNLASTTLDLVQDVNYTQSGVFRTFFHYGDVDVQTAGEAPHFDFDAVPQPDKVAHIIGGLIGKKWK